MELNKTFINGLWNKEINVSDFVSKNIAPYTEGTEKVSLLCGNLKLIGIYSSDKLVYVPIFL